MHEFGIAEAIVKAVLAEVRKLDNGAKLTCVKVVIGKLQEIVPENLTFAYETLAKGTLTEGSKLEIIDIPVTVKCNACGWEGEVAGIAFVCGNCESHDVRVVKGMELYLDKLEVEVDE